MSEILLECRHERYESNKSTYLFATRQNCTDKQLKEPKQLLFRCSAFAMSISCVSLVAACLTFDISRSFKVVSVGNNSYKETFVRCNLPFPEEEEKIYSLIYTQTVRREGANLL